MARPPRKPDELALARTGTSTARSLTGLAKAGGEAVHLLTPQQASMLGNIHGGLGVLGGGLGLAGTLASEADDKTKALGAASGALQGAQGVAQLAGTSIPYANAIALALALAAAPEGKAGDVQRAQALASAGGSAAGALAAGAAGGAAGGLVALPLVAGALFGKGGLWGGRGEQFDVLEHRGINALGPSLTNGLTPDPLPLVGMNADQMAASLGVSPQTFVNAAKASGGPGGLASQAQWANEGRTILPVSDPLARLLNPQNIPNWNPLGMSLGNASESDPVAPSLYEALYHSAMGNAPLLPHGWAAEPNESPA